MSGDVGRYHAILLGRWFDHRQVDLTAIPAEIEIAGDRYRRLNDPDTGEYLGGYTSVDASLRLHP